MPPLTREEMAAVVREEMARVSPIPMNAEETMRRIGEGMARSRADDVSDRMEQARMTGSGNGNGQKARVDWTLNLPTMMTGLGFAVTVFVYIGGLDRRIAGVEQSVVIANERATRYVPRIEAAELKNELQDSQNKVQEERIQNLAVAVQELRKVNNEVMTVLGNIREDVAVIKERLQIARTQRQTEKR